MNIEKVRRRRLLAIAREQKKLEGKPRKRFADLSISDQKLAIKTWKRGEKTYWLPENA